MGAIRLPAKVVVNVREKGVKFNLKPAFL